MTTLKKIWVDPPSGWRFGFPKIYDPMKDNPNINDWIIEQGYPQKLRDQFKDSFHYRYWEVEDEQKS